MAWYRQGLKAILTGTCSWTSSTIIASLIKNTYTPSATADEFWDDISTHEVAVSGYTQSTLASKTSASDTTPVRVRLLAADIDWVGLGTGETCAYVVVWHDTATPSTSSLLFYYPIGSQAMGGNHTLTWDALGLAGMTT